jgi:hypothetical protein
LKKLKRELPQDENLAAALFVACGGFFAQRFRRCLRVLVLHTRMVEFESA